MRDRRLPRLLTIATGTRHDFFAALLACRESSLGTSGGSCGKKAPQRNDCSDKNYVPPIGTLPSNAAAADERHGRNDSHGGHGRCRSRLSGKPLVTINGRTVCPSSVAPKDHPRLRVDALGPMCDDRNPVRHVGAEVVHGAPLNADGTARCTARESPALSRLMICFVTRCSRDSAPPIASEHGHNVTFGIAGSAARNAVANEIVHNSSQSRNVWP